MANYNKASIIIKELERLKASSLCPTTNFLQRRQNEDLLVKLAEVIARHTAVTMHFTTIKSIGKTKERRKAKTILK